MAPRPTPIAVPGTESVGSGDLSLIRHVGPGTMQRLHEAGISTLAAVAASTVDQLAEASGYAAAKIESEDWIGQAIRLTGGGQNDALALAPQAEPAHRLTTFRLELTIQPDGTVHHSDVTCSKTTHATTTGAVGTVNVSLPSSATSRGSTRLRPVLRRSEGRRPTPNLRT